MALHDEQLGWPRTADGVGRVNGSSHLAPTYRGRHASAGLRPLTRPAPPESATVGAVSRDLATTAAGDGNRPKPPPFGRWGRSVGVLRFEAGRAGAPRVENSVRDPKVAQTQLQRVEGPR